MNIIFFCNFNYLFDISLINAKFTLWSSSNNMVGSSCSNFRVDPNEDILSLQLFLEVAQSLKCPNIESNSYFKCVVEFLG